MRYADPELPWTVQALDNTQQAGSALLFGRAAWLRGWVITDGNNVGGSVVRVIDGGDNRGQLVGQVRLAQGQTHTLNTGEPGWPLDQGLFLQIDSGTVTAAFIIAEQGAAK